MAATPMSSAQHRSQWVQVYQLLILFCAVLLAVTELPNRIWDNADSILMVTLGPLAVWRYGWWLTHCIRAVIYRQLVFPKLRRRADALWSTGWRPPFVHFLVPTFKERPEITRLVLQSIFGECRRAGVPGRIFIATSDVCDEQVVEAYCAEIEESNVEVIIVRQNQPGKRAAMGLGMRAMSRYGVGPDDLAVCMDGDSILLERILERCAPLFALNKKLGALTTDESAVVNGPGWIQNWFNMRFAQRRLAMQSHSLSRKVLTLTGRLSMFRATLVIDPEFIRTIEADCLDHWLWGRFRFLSGDDKSSWFALLRNGHEMLYVPDASVFTIENIGPRPFQRVQENLMRWSGNMLRSGSRALALGPRRCGFFIWWCILDQRLSIWTSPSGLVMAAVLSLAISFKVLLGYAAWVFVTRTMLSLVLYFYAGGVYASFPFLLYASQLSGSVVKIYLLFRVSKQRWLNRGDQRSNAGGKGWLPFESAMATFLTAFYLGAYIFAVCIGVGLVDWNSISLAWVGRLPFR
jgi:mannuronan synthase